jgi:glycosyltransferase involved in cell wall biosynthesis
MRIALLSDQESAGGAAVATSRLAYGLVQKGCEVLRVVAYADGAQHSWHTTMVKLPPPARGSRSLRRLPFGSRILRRMNRDATVSAIGEPIRKFRPDIISIHNIHGANWPLAVVEDCLECAPTVWTLHDMWSFTGRCVYSYDCRKFVDGCDASCPTQDEYPHVEAGKIHLEWDAKRRSIRGERRLTAVAPSRWLAELAAEGFWKGKRMRRIANGLPLSRYSPRPRTGAREQFGISGSKPVLLAVAYSLEERRKGMHLLIDALERTKTAITLLLVGAGDIKLSERHEVVSLGLVQDEETMVLAYNATDFLVHPAPIDNLPNVIAEALACGTPVVAFAVGGIPEMVRSGESGWLAADVSAAALAEALDRAVGDLRSGVSLRSTARAHAEREYDDLEQAGRYIEVFREMVEGI